MQVELRITLLGAPTLTLAGKLVTGFVSNKAAALLYYLAATNRPHSRDVLAALLWPDAPEEAAKKNLRDVLSNLRRLVEPYLDITRQTAALRTDAVIQVDSLNFAANIKAAQAETATEQRNARLREATLLYRGEFLQGFHVAEAAPFEEWVLSEREHYRQLALQALHLLTVNAEQRKAYLEGIDYATRLLALEPWAEETHRQLMRLLAASGQRSAALAHYETCRRVLASELGAAPDAETEALVAQIRQGDLPAKNLATKVTYLRNDDAPPVASVVPTASEAPSVNVHQALVNPKSKIQNRVDWGEAPDVGAFYGRQAEVAELERWLLRDRCRLVTILGMGGMGKTTLVAQVTKQLAGQFDVVIWRSLLNAPPLTEILRTWLQCLADGEHDPGLDTLDAQLTRLFAYLREKRCLLVLDNAESIMQDETREEAASRYRTGYEAYGQLLKRIGESSHQSCLVLTSRELPPEIARLERETPLVTTLALTGVANEVGQQLLRKQGVAGPPALTNNLVQHYSGNPLALLLVAETIQELFDGDIASFLSDEAPIFDDIRDVLDQQFARLSALEQEILLWLAIEREPLSLQQLSANIRRPLPRRALVEALNSLRRRSMLEKITPEEQNAPSDGGGFTLQNVVAEYLTHYLAEQICREIEQKASVLLKRYALLKAQAKEYVRQSQARLLLQPIGKRLLAQWGQTRLPVQINALLDILRRDEVGAQSYAGGNLLNLLLHLRTDLRGTDFSHLAVWQAYLADADLAGVNFTQSDLTNCVFADTFGVIMSLAFSPEGQPPPGAAGLVLAAGTANDGKIRLWRVADGQRLGLLEGHTNMVWTVRFSPDGTLLASGSGDQTVRLWDLRVALAGETPSPLLRTLRGHSDGIWQLNFSPDGRTLASASADGTICLWAVATGERLHTLLGHIERVRTVAFSPDGRLLVSGSSDNTVRLWDVQTGRALATLTGHTEWVWSVAFSPDGRLLASGSWDRTIRLWGLERLLAAAATGVQTTDLAYQVLTGHTDAVIAVAFSRDSQRLISASEDRTVREWDVYGEGREVARQILQNHPGRIWYMTFADDRQRLAGGGGDLTARLWDVRTGHLVRTLQGYAQGVMAITFSPDGALLAAAYQDYKVRLWDIQTKTLLTVLHGHTDEVDAVAFSPSQTANGTGALTLASGGVDRTIHLWDIYGQAENGGVRGRPRLTLPGGAPDWVRALAFSPDGTRLASASSDPTVKVWDTHTGEVLHVLAANDWQVWSVAFSPDGRLLAAASLDTLIYLWDMHAAQPAANFVTLPGHTNWVTTVAFSPNGALLASGGFDQTVRVWDLHIRAALFVLQGHSEWVWSVAFSPDSTRIASSSSDNTVCVWDAQRGELLYTLRGHTNWVRSVAFSPDGQTLASASSDETVKLWDVQTGQLLATLHAPGPYAGMNITGVTGLTEAQKATLRALGAVETM